MSRIHLTIALVIVSLAPLQAVASDLEARLKQGAELAARGDRVAAQALFERLAAEHPDRPEPLNDLAALAAAAGDLPRARALLERALATQPSFRAVHDNLATIYAAEAAAAYRKALPLDAAPTERPTLVMLTETGAPPQLAAVPVPIAQPSVSYSTLATASVGAATGPIVRPDPKVALAIPTPPAPAIATRSTARPATPLIPLRDLFDGRAHAAFTTVDAWISAWVRRDVPGYLAAYAPEFVPPDGLGRSAWEAQRAERIRAPQRIAITIEQRHLVFDRDGKRAQMTFTQRYRSERFNSDSFKTLTLVERQGRWLIAAERTGR